LHSFFLFLAFSLCLFSRFRSLATMSKLPNAARYDSYAYHISLLKDFVPSHLAEGLTGDSTGSRKRTSSARVGGGGGGDSRRSMVGGGGIGGGIPRTVHTDSNGSFGSVRSAGNRRSGVTRSVVVHSKQAPIEIQQLPRDAAAAAMTNNVHSRKGLSRAMSTR
jgi:hypothetical protein